MSMIDADAHGRQGGREGREGKRAPASKRERATASASHTTNKLQSRQGSVPSQRRGTPAMRKRTSWKRTAVLERQHGAYPLPRENPPQLSMSGGGACASSPSATTRTIAFLRPVELALADAQKHARAACRSPENLGAFGPVAREKGPGGHLRGRPPAPPPHACQELWRHCMRWARRVWKMRPKMEPIATMRALHPDTSKPSTPRSCHRPSGRGKRTSARALDEIDWRRAHRHKPTPHRQQSTPPVKAGIRLTSGRGVGGYTRYTERLRSTLFVYTRRGSLPLLFRVQATPI